MRKIKFRGKRKDRVWVYGWYINKAEAKHQIVTKDDVMPILVIPETVGQFTGLTDKNGKEIYEGDIVKLTSVMPFCAFGYEFIGKVDFSEFAYFVDNGKEAYSLFSETDEIEIIGNIHDNPELLNKE